MTDPLGEREHLQDLLAELETAVRRLSDRQTVPLPFPWRSVGRIARSMERLLWEPERTELDEALRRLIGAPASELPGAAETVLTVARRALERPVDRRARILIVEDDRVLATGVARVFERHGWDVMIVGEAAAALATLRGEPVSAVLLDLVLPDADGRNVLLNIKDDPCLVTLPVYVASARTDEYVERECLALPWSATGGCCSIRGTVW